MYIASYAHTKGILYAAHTKVKWVTKSLYVLKKKRYATTQFPSISGHINNALAYISDTCT